MFKEYLELLKKGYDALSGLNLENCTLNEYLQAVGYEFKILFLGILYIGGFLLILTLPFLLNWGIKKYFECKLVKEFGEYCRWTLSDLKHTIYKSKEIFTEKSKDYIHRTLSQLFDLPKYFSKLKDLKEFKDNFISIGDKIVELINECHAILKAENVDFDNMQKDDYSLDENEKLVAKTKEIINLLTKEELYEKFNDLYTKIYNKENKYNIIKNIIVGITAFLYIMFMLPFAFAIIASCKWILAIIAAIAVVAFFLWIMS